MAIFQFDRYRIAIHVFQKRGQFYWCGSSSSNKSVKWFNDVPRAVHPFSIIELKDSLASKYLMKIPSDVDKFLFDYRHSKFIECHSTSNNYNFTNSMDGTYGTEKPSILPCMVHFASTLENNYKTYWLSYGSILGI